ISRVYDPEGILSTIPAIVTTLFGVLTGYWLRAKRASALMTSGLCFAGLVALVLGLAWDRWLPINKSLWTSSYTLFTGGAALVALGLCYWTIDVKGWRWWTPPFVALGMNALAVFFLSTLLAKLLLSVHVVGAGGRATVLHAVLFERLFATWTSPATASLAWAFMNVLLWLAVMWPLYRKDIRLTV